MSIGEKGRDLAKALGLAGAVAMSGCANKDVQEEPMPAHKHVMKSEDLKPESLEQMKQRIEETKRQLEIERKNLETMREYLKGKNSDKVKWIEEKIPEKEKDIEALERVLRLYEDKIRFAETFMVVPSDERK